MKIQQALRLLHDAPVVSPRGMTTKELEDVLIEVYPSVEGAICILNWPSLTTNIPYLATELAWYLKADRYDLSICNHAKIWANHVQNNILESQYGHYWFRERGLVRALQFLREDPNSRRAVVPMIEPRHMHIDAKDVPCTMSLSFRLREDRLNMSVHMRSQDAVFGLRNDLPAFSMVQCLAAAWLGVKVGTIVLHVDSFHVYERHFGTLSKIITEPLIWDTFPMPTAKLANALFLGHGCNVFIENTTFEDDPFVQWIRKYAKT